MPRITENLKKLDAKLTISRPSCSDGRKFITIEITDQSSGCIAVDVEIGLEDFAEAITGLACRPCSMLFNASGVVGKKHEHKTETVFVPEHNYGDREAAARKALKPHETDGWRGTVSDCNNTMHRTVKHGEVRDGVKGRLMRVTFHRYV